MQPKFEPVQFTGEAREQSWIRREADLTLMIKDLQSQVTRLQAGLKKAEIERDLLRSIVERR